MLWSKRGYWKVCLLKLSQIPSMIFSHHLIGSTQTSLNALTSHQQNQLELIKTKKNKGVPIKVPKGILHFMDVQIRKEFTFLDFIASGLVKFLTQNFSQNFQFATWICSCSRFDCFEWRDLQIKFIALCELTIFESVRMCHMRCIGNMWTLQSF